MFNFTNKEVQIDFKKYMSFCLLAYLYFSISEYMFTCHQKRYKIAFFLHANKNANYLCLSYIVGREIKASFLYCWWNVN